MIIISNPQWRNMSSAATETQDTAKAPNTPLQNQFKTKQKKNKRRKEVK